MLRNYRYFAVNKRDQNYRKTYFPVPRDTVVITVFIQFILKFLSPKKVKRQAMYLLRNTEARLCNNCCSGKAKRITYLACVSATLGIQYVMRMRHIPSVACLALPYFSALSHKRRDIR
jgi:hypothetical protein